MKENQFGIVIRFYLRLQVHFVGVCIVKFRLHIQRFHHLEFEEFPKCFLDARRICIVHFTN